jgi:hypothetical protein
MLQAFKDTARFLAWFEAHPFVKVPFPTMTPLFAIDRSDLTRSIHTPAGRGCKGAGETHDPLGDPFIERR